MELFNPKLKISCFLGESFRVFHQCFFRCFHFCHAFISSDAFIVDCTSLFVRYFAFVLFIFLFLVFVDLREHFFLSDIIYLHSFLFLTRLPWGGGGGVGSSGAWPGTSGSLRWAFSPTDRQPFTRRHQTGRRRLPRRVHLLPRQTGQGARADRAGSRGAHFRMTDPDEIEQRRLEAAKRDMAEVIAEIGFDVAPSEWTAKQALTVVTAAVNGWLSEAPF